MDLNDTQALDLDESVEVEEEEEAKRDRKQVGQLKVFRRGELEEKVYNIHEGENFIGRDESSDVQIPIKSLSKTHACIEVCEDLHLVYDDDSKNRTRRDKMILKPQVRYELHHGDMLTFADTKCQYFKGRIEKVDDDTGSETGSESMLPLADKDTNKEDDAFDADTESETDDEKNPVHIKKPAYSSDEKSNKEDVSEDSDYPKPVVPAFMYDSNDDDDDENAFKQADQNPSGHVKAHMDMSVDSGTLAFAFVSPDDVPVIRPNSKKMPETSDIENTPLTLVYSPDTQDKTPDNPSIPVKNKDEGSACAATLIYGNESLNQEKSPVRFSAKEDCAEISTDDSETPEKTLIKNVSKSQIEFEGCEATLPVHEIKSLEETPLGDVPSSCKPTLLYDTGSLKETPLKHMPNVGETPTELSICLPETQGFSPGNEETSVCEPTQTYLQESLLDTPKETPGAMVRNIPDSDEEVEDEKEETSQSDSELRKHLSFDDSATQAYTWNDSDATDDEDEELQFQATQPYPSHLNQPEKERAETSSSMDEDHIQQLAPPEVNVQQRSPSPPSSPHKDMQQTLAYAVTEKEAQACDTETKDKGKGPKDDNAEPQYKMEMETQPYDVQDGPKGSRSGEKEKAVRDENSASSANLVKRAVIEPTLPYDISDMETQDIDEEDDKNITRRTSNADSDGNDLMRNKEAEVEPTLPYDISETETQDDDEEGHQYNTKQTSKKDPEDSSSLTRHKDPLVEPTVPYDLEMATQAYLDGDSDDIETDDEDNQESTVFENKAQSRENQTDNEEEIMETQAYGADMEQEDDDISAGPSNNEDAYGETQPYGLEDQLTSPSTAEDVVPDSEDALSQEIPYNKINKLEDTVNNNVSKVLDKTTEKEHQVAPNSDKQKIEESSNQEETEIIIRPARRGRGRVTQQSAEEENQPAIPYKPAGPTTKITELSTRSRKKGKQSIDESKTAEDVKVQRSTRGKRPKKTEAPPELKDTSDESEENQFKTTTKRDKNVQEQRYTRGRRSKRSEVEDILPDVNKEDYKESEAMPKKRLKSGRRSKKSELEPRVEDTLPDDTEEIQEESPLLKKATRGRRSKKSEAEVAVKGTLPDDTEEIQEEPLLLKKATRGRRSKKSEAEVEVKDTSRDFIEDVRLSFQPAPAPDENLPVQKSQRGRIPKKNNDEKAKMKEPIMSDDTAQDENKPRSTRGTRLKEMKEKKEARNEETLPDDNKEDVNKLAPSREKSISERPSTSRTRSEKSKAAPRSGRDILPDSKEDQDAVKHKKKGDTAISLAADQESSGMDEELPSLDVILTGKKATKGKGTTTEKLKYIETSELLSKKDSLTRETIEDEEFCSKPVTVKPLFPRRGRGRVTQSDESTSKVPGTCESDMVEFEQEGLMSPRSVAKSISSRKGKKTREPVPAVEKESEMDLSESPSSISASPVGNKGRKRGKAAAKSEPMTAELDDSQCSVASSVESRTTRRGRGKTTKSAQLDDTHLQIASPVLEITESQSSTTSSVETKTKGKGRRRTGKLAPALDTTQEEEAKETPAKKTRTSKQDDSPTVLQSPSLRERKDLVPKIMFTGVFDKQADKIVTSLGGTLVDSVYECTHLITDKVRRTVKFLCGVASGQMIVQPQWLTACKKAKHFIEPEPFIVSDKASEKQYAFSLHESLEKAHKGGLLEGYKIHMTKNVKPEPNQMKDIIKCAQGEYLPRIPRTMEENVLVISCEADQDLCKPALACGLPVYSAELLLTGILRQELQLDQNRLFADKVGEVENTRKRKNESVVEETPTRSTSSRSSKRKKK